MLAFGPDGRLYVGTGDGGGAGGQFGTTRDLSVLLAKILRLDVEATSDGAPYGTSGNPFLETLGAAPEIWAYGLRNPRRFSFDRETGDLWIGDVGQGGWEEINHAAAGVGGQDYGWNIREGDHCFGTPSGGRELEGAVDPIAEYDHRAGCSVVGGYVYRGVAAPLQGRYLFADTCSGRVWSLESEEPRTLREMLRTGRTPSSFGQGDDGELYLLDLKSGELLSIAVSG